MADKTTDKTINETREVTQSAKTLAEAPGVYAGEATETVKAELKAWEQEVETWFNDLRQNLRELDTEAHNKLFAAKEALKARLTAIL
jgi:hypothetical protein